MQVTPVNMDEFLENHKKMDHIKYGYAAKAVPLSISPSRLTHLDCSGYIRKNVYDSADGYTIEDGSYIQRRQFEQLGLTQVSYAEACEAENRLFFAVATSGVNGVGSIAHIWAIFNKRTYESYSGEGVGSLPATEKWRRTKVHKTFEYPIVTKEVFQAIYKLYQSSGAFMRDLKVFNGVSYVPARAWGKWQGKVVHWDEKTRLINYNGIPVNKGVDTKIIQGDAHIPFRVAAEATGTMYMVDTKKRNILLQK